LALRASDEQACLTFKVSLEQGLFIGGIQMRQLIPHSFRTGGANALSGCTEICVVAGNGGGGVVIVIHGRISFWHEKARQKWRAVGWPLV
jgi:hypothetical protein